MHPTCRPFALLAAAAAATLAARSAGATQYTLQHASSIDLSPYFFAADAVNATPASDYGSFPLSVAFDGANAYVGGYNENPLAAASNVGIVKVSNALSASPSIAGLSSTIFNASASRGLNDLSFDTSSGSLYGAYDTGVGTPTINRWTPSGAVTWSVAAPQRPFALAVDPVGDAGAPGVGYLNQSAGRRLELKAADGSAIYTPSGGANPGGIILPPPTAQGNTWRSLGFDSVGNIVLGEDNGVYYGTRANVNAWQTLAGTLGNTTSAVLESVATNNVGKGVAILQSIGTTGGVGSLDLIAFAPR